MTISNKQSHILTILLAIVVSWFPISRFILGFDFNGRTALIIMLFLFLVFLGEIRKVALKRPLISFCLLNIYIIINSFVKGLDGYEPGWFVFITYMICPLIFMWLIVVLSRIDFDRTLRSLLIIFYLYTLLTLLDTASLSHPERYGSVINANTLALNVLFTIIFASFLYIRDLFSLTKYFFILLVPVVIEIATGSRMGVISMALVLLSVYVIKAGVSSKNIFGIILFGFVLFISAKYVLDNTAVGERILSTQEQSASFSERYETGTVLDYLGDRGAQYNLSWPVFLDNIWTGIGFGNWVLKNPLNLVCHSQYMVLYLENGIIAFVLYVVAIIWYLARLISISFRNIKGKDKQTSLLFIAVFVVLLLMNLVLWTYDAYGYYAIFALAYVAIVYKKEKQRI